MCFGVVTVWKAAPAPLRVAGSPCTIVRPLASLLTRTLSPVTSVTPRPAGAAPSRRGRGGPVRTLPQVQPALAPPCPPSPGPPAPTRSTWVDPWIPPCFLDTKPTPPRAGVTVPAALVAVKKRGQGAPPESRRGRLRQRRRRDLVAAFPDGTSYLAGRLIDGGDDADGGSDGDALCAVPTIDPVLVVDIVSAPHPFRQSGDQDNRLPRLRLVCDDGLGRLDQRPPRPTSIPDSSFPVIAPMPPCGPIW